MKLFLFLFSLFSFFISIFPDAIYLNDGSIVIGTLLEQSERYFIYRDEKGIVRTIPKGKVKNIVPGNTWKNVITEANDQSKPETTKEEETEKDVTVEITHEFASDYIWRGQNTGGDFLARRNNTSYKSFNEYWAYQPNLLIEHKSGLYFEMWGNFALHGRNDKDSDLRFQSSPGAKSIDPFLLAERIGQQNFIADANGNSALFDPTNNIQNDVCSDPATAQTSLQGNRGAVNECFVNPTSIKKHKEQNGMSRTDGLFTTFAYKFNNGGKLGTFTMGTWWYFQNDRSAKYSWNEYFIWWDLPILKGILDPSIQAFTQSSYDANGGGAGNQYMALYNSHTFFEGKDIQLYVYNNIGYQWLNNNTSRKSGVIDVSSGIKIIFKDFFVSFNHVYRPDIYLYDNDNFFFTNSNASEQVANRSPYDGRVTDPSKLYGTYNDLVYQQINNLNESDLVKIYLKEQYQLQDIPKNLFWVSVGFTHSI